MVIFNMHYEQYQDLINAIDLHYNTLFKLKKNPFHKEMCEDMKKIRMILDNSKIKHHKQEVTKCLQTQ